MYRAKQLLPLLAVAGLAYLLYANWQLEETEELAYATGCSSGCSDKRPAKKSRNPFVHEYEWPVGGGVVEVVCRRGMILLGRWTCKIQGETAAAVEGKDDMRQFPHQTERGL